MKPTLIVTVDTEEEGLWSGVFRVNGYTTRNLAGIGRFQSLCDGFGVRPTYLVDTPVLRDDRAVEALNGIQDAGRCEVGAHLHPWCAPPFEEQTNPRNSFLCNLPEPLQHEKLVRLTEAVEQRIGRRPTSFRAGRYGLDIVGARVLEDLGYVVDSSVISFTDYSPQGGVDFTAAAYTPYRIGRTDLLAADPAGRLLEVPVSVGYSRPGFRRAQRIRRFAERPALRRFHLVGALDRLNLVRRIKFSPEQADAARLRQLVDAYTVNRAPCVVMMLHSSSLVTGCSPYARDERKLEDLYHALTATFEYCVRRRGMGTATLTGFAQSFMGGPGCRE